MDGNLWAVIQFTLWQSSLVTLLSLTFGGTFAILERLAHRQTPAWFLAVWSLPLFLPPLIVGTGFIHVLGQAGDFNTLLSWLHLPTIPFLYQPRAVVLAHLYYNIPLAYLAMRATLQGISVHTEEAARVLGASSSTIVQTVWWPQLKSTVSGIGIVIFLYCWTSFALPLQLGGSHAKTIEVWLYEQLVLYQHVDLASGVAFLQTLSWFIPIVVLLRFRPLHLSSYHPNDSKQTVRFPFTYLVLGIVWMSPLLSLVIHTVTQLQVSTVSTLFYSSFGSSVLRTLLLTAAVTGSLLVACLLLRLPTRWTTLLLTISPVTLSIFWLNTFGQNLLSLGLALIIGLLPLACYLISQRRQQMPTWLLDTAKSLGANHRNRTLLELKWLQPAIQQVAALGMVFVLGDIALASVLTPTNQPTTMQVAYGLLSSYRFQVGSLAMVLILAMILTLQYLIYTYRHADRRTA